ncbi:AraC family transcriptional regulator [Mycobacterium sp. NPDC050441]|uniref:AraC family transcriptional regulator n=1 Tax=Mycobacterium sp. NPDC050441 TaxID=3155403 RepID=UPI0033DD4A90
MTGAPATDVSPTVPIGRIQAFVRFALANGWDVAAVMQRAGISPMLLAEGRSRVTTDQAAIFVRELWRVTDDELLGFGTTPVPRGTFRLVCHALLSTSGDLRDGLQRFVEFNAALPGTPPVGVTFGTEDCTFSIDLHAVDSPLDVLVDSLLAIVHRFLGWAINATVPLRRVEVPYPQPADIDDYDVIFGAPVRFSAPTAALVIDNRVLSAPIVRTQDEVEAFVRNAPADFLVQRDYATSLADRVRRMLQRGPSGSWPTTDDIARAVALSPQSVRRKLREEGTSIRELRESVLRDSAIASLARGDETIAELSARLGFSEPSAFTRAFRRWTGSAPRSYQPR